MEYNVNDRALRGGAASAVHARYPVGFEESKVGTETKKKSYVGSVLFFKHVILAVVIVSIAVPTSLAVVFGVELQELRQQTTALRTQLSEMATELQAAEQSAAEETATTPTGSGPQQPEVPAYTALYPELYAEPADYASDDADNRVYLTFDDGPSERTDEILAILEKYGVKATFFVIAADGEEDLQRMRNIVAAGHTLAIHSYSHNYRQIYGSVEAYLEDFNQMYCQIEEATGVKPQIFRFPGGSINSYNNGIYREIIAEMTRRGFVYFDWNVANGDAATNTTQPASTLAANALKGVGTTRRAIILMHDSTVKTTTVEALPSIIEGYLNAGYSFAPLTAATKPISFSYLN